MVCLLPPHGTNINVIERAMQRVLDELIAILQQVGTELAASTREMVQRVQIELAGKLARNTVMSRWLASIGRGAKSLLRFRLTDNSSGRLKIH
jgi:hypothetical protein